MPTFEASRKGLNNLWSRLQISPDKRNEALTIARKLASDKPRYKKVQETTGVPWWWTAITNWREQSGKFDGAMHNGDKIIGTDKLTTHIPAGRGPFPTWEASADDVLRMKDLDEIKDWSVARALYEWERYNGFGYQSRSLPGGPINSPYVFAWTNLQQRGKYTSDGSYDPSHWDEQPGTAALLKALIELGEVQIDEPDMVEDGALAPVGDYHPPPLQLPAGVDMGRILQAFLPLLPDLIMLVMSDNMPVEQRRALKSQLMNKALAVLFGGGTSLPPTLQPVAAPDFGNILQVVGPIIGGLFGGPVGGAAGNVGGQIISSLLQGVFNQRR